MSDNIPMFPPTPLSPDGPEPEDEKGMGGRCWEFTVIISVSALVILCVVVLVIGAGVSAFGV